MPTIFSNINLNNKSINEHLLLLTGLIHVPENEPIVKISGRYRLNDKFEFGDLEKYDFIVRAFDFQKLTGVISTRCFMVKNKEILEDVLTHSLYELFGYGLRVVGLRSGINFLKSLFKPQINKESTVAIEMSMGRAIKFLNYKYNAIPLMGLEGLAAGSTDFGVRIKLCTQCRSSMKQIPHHLMPKMKAYIVQEKIDYQCPNYGIDEHI